MEVSHFEAMVSRELKSLLLNYPSISGVIDGNLR